MSGHRYSVEVAGSNDSERMSQNRRGWALRTQVHVISDFYDLASFRKGRIALRALEQEELGDVRGRSLLHLQCHFGMDTLSWARLGAHVTGADFSEEAIATARSLAEELDIEARFVCANLYDLPDVLEGEFDIVVTTYGVLSRLPDLDGWLTGTAPWTRVPCPFDSTRRVPPTAPRRSRMLVSPAPSPCGPG
jgi:2-polyprenyl-3-methyl-5-hydroxy-6-metoxy-1,4-benzoquinol methylase